MRFYIFFLSIFFTLNIKAQEGVPVYFDYLTENYYLVHPSMAGVNLVGGKLRMTASRRDKEILDNTTKEEPALIEEMEEKSN